MSREANYQAIILKKQPFGEADEIITFFTREAGKVRGLAKSVKLAKSKLQNSLQALFLVNLSLAGSGFLPKIISAEPKKTFSRLRRDLSLVKRAFYASEVVLKFTPDGQKNGKLFDLLLNFLDHLENNGRNLEFALAKFKAGFLSAAGFGVSFHQDLKNQQQKLKQCGVLESRAFSELEGSGLGDIGPLQKFLSDFIVYHLEREVKSESFLESVL